MGAGAFELNDPEELGAARSAERAADASDFVVVGLAFCVDGLIPPELLLTGSAPNAVDFMVVQGDLQAGLPERAALTQGDCRLGVATVVEVYLRYAADATGRLLDQLGGHVCTVTCLPQGLVNQ